MNTANRSEPEDTPRPLYAIANSGMADSEGEIDFWAHQLIACQASERPDAVAVHDDRQALTFAELAQRANRLARHLGTLGVGKETAVGLYFNRSVDFVVAALAVLAAGGAYVPLDASYPPGRIDTILKDANVPVVLCHKWMGASLAGGPWKIVDLDVDRVSISKNSDDPLDTQIEGDQLAYIIYTSGSTGLPKGVEVTHSNLLHLIKWHRRAFCVSHFDRASQVAGLAFDAAVWEIWCNLAAGASLYLIDEVSRQSPEGTKDWLVENEITIAFTPTIMAEHLIILDWPNTTMLRLLLTGADTLHRYPNADLPFELVNNYGPTECTVLVTSGLIRAGHAKAKVPPIGSAIDNTEILILDAELMPVPLGQEGEICVSGPQVARGYRNLPDLTSTKFTRQPGTGKRIYRTGDRGKELPDGQFAFLGRLDDQIKIRGFLVEPNEVITHLNSHSQIISSTVTAIGCQASDRLLVAYVVTANESSVSASEVRTFLQARLPDYMVPRIYVSIPSLPLTSTGKCNKRALPAPTPENRLADWNDGLSPNLPKSATERRVAELISGLLNGQYVRRKENFFVVGGHSMLAAQLLARIKKPFRCT